MGSRQLRLEFELKWAWQEAQPHILPPQFDQVSRIRVIGGKD